MLDRKKLDKRRRRGGNTKGREEEKEWEGGRGLLQAKEGRQQPYGREDIWVS